MVRIGKINIRNNLFLAPLAGITSLPFRLLCKRAGAGLCYSEMISSEGLVRSNIETSGLAKTCNEEKPVAMQIFGTDPETMAKAAQMLDKKADIIDINLGCPAKQVVRTGAGSALLKDCKAIKDIIRAVSMATDIPITAKIRAYKDNDYTVKLGKDIESSGAKAICIHGRTPSQGYHAKADWKIIRALKKELSVPVIGNGDVRSKEDYESMLSMTGCDAVMVGRAAMGNPGIFHEILTGEKSDLSLGFREFLKIAKEYRIENFFHIKQHAMLFTKNKSHARELRREIMHARTIEEIIRAWPKEEG